MASELIKVLWQGRSPSKVILDELNSWNPSSLDSFRARYVNPLLPPPPDEPQEDKWKSGSKMFVMSGRLMLSETYSARVNMFLRKLKESSNAQQSRVGPLTRFFIDGVKLDLPYWRIDPLGSYFTLRVELKSVLMDASLSTKQIKDSLEDLGLDIDTCIECQLLQGNDFCDHIRADHFHLARDCMSEFAQFVNEFSEAGLSEDEGLKIAGYLEDGTPLVYRQDSKVAPANISEYIWDDPNATPLKDMKEHLKKLQMQQYSFAIPINVNEVAGLQQDDDERFCLSSKFSMARCLRRVAHKAHEWPENDPSHYCVGIPKSKKSGPRKR